MELRAFVCQTIIDILGAVEDAQKKAKPGTVVPWGISTRVGTGGLPYSPLQTLDFEVTVRADEHAGSHAKLNVVAAVIGGGVHGESGKKEGHASTLKFKIPLRLPESKAD